MFTIKRRQTDGQELLWGSEEHMSVLISFLTAQGYKDIGGNRWYRESDDSLADICIIRNLDQFSYVTTPPSPVSG